MTDKDPLFKSLVELRNKAWELEDRIQRVVWVLLGTIVLATSSIPVVFDMQKKLNDMEIKVKALEVK